MKELGINIQAGTSFGWGIVGLNLVLEFIRQKEISPILTIPPGKLDLPQTDRDLFQQAQDASGMIIDFNNQNPGKPFILDIPMVYSGGNQFQHRLNVGTSKERYSITVFEDSNLGIRQDAEKEHFHKIFAGCKWNADILQASGFKNVHTWNQGVDTSLFFPQESAKKFPGRFLVFSGGKIEFRKGQDLVIEAFRRFQENHKDALLVTAWDSPWMNLVKTMAPSPWVSPPPEPKVGKRVDISSWLESEGIPTRNHWDIGAIPNREMPEILRQCNAGVFPSRAEGATNLVAMEAIACGLPSLVSQNTGHLDLLEDIPAIPIQNQHKLPNPPPNTGTEGWGESDIDEIVSSLEWIYANPGESKGNALEASNKIKARSWAGRIQEFAHQLLT